MTPTGRTAAATAKPGLALYVHWPFCLSKCPYCDFNSHVVDRVDHSQWREALLTELAFEAARTPDFRLTSIFFGGGTPSLMEAETARALIEAAKASWPSEPDLEVTLEANPGTVDAARFAAFRNAGVNRLSLGVQSLNDSQLKFLGRKHSAGEAKAAVTLAGSIFDRLSFDLIYARPGQTTGQWKTELSDALELLTAAGGGHVSCYQLTIEDQTPFKKDYERGLFTLPDENGGSDLFDLTQDVLTAAGLPAYEVSNHAKAGDACRHNVHIWRGGPYAGIGPGAHGRVEAGGTVYATQRLKAPAHWLKRVASQGHGTQSEIEIGQADRAIEMVLMGLRLDEGLDLSHLEHVTGVPRFKVISEEGLKMMESEGLIEVSSDQIRTTRRGRLVLNGIVQELLS
jgi:oxygen-independent coproporphyrinogen-3 oxidase